MIGLNQVNLGYNLYYYPEVDVNGFDFARQVVRIISKYGQKNIYNHAHYHACGQGAVGFDLLHQKKCQTVTLCDPYEPARRGCEITSERQGWQDCVTVIPDLTKVGQKIDLFVSDLPWWRETLPGTTITKQQERCLFDFGLKLHRQMFSEIQDLLTNDSDLFIIKDSKTIWTDLLPSYLTLENTYQLKYFLSKKNTVSTITRAEILHLRKKQ